MPRFLGGEFGDTRSAALIAAIAGVAFIVWYRSRSQVQRAALVAASGSPPDATAQPQAGGLISPATVPGAPSPSAKTAQSMQQFLNENPGFVSLPLGQQASVWHAWAAAHPGWNQ